jgi:hypothetical protein
MHLACCDLNPIKHPVNTLPDRSLPFKATNHRIKTLKRRLVHQSAALSHQPNPNQNQCGVIWQHSLWAPRLVFRPIDSHISLDGLWHAAAAGPRRSSLTINTPFSMQQQQQHSWQLVPGRRTTLTLLAPRILARATPT